MSADKERAPREFMAALEKDAALIESRLGKLFVVAGVLRMTPLELIAAAQFFMAYGTFALRSAPNDPHTESMVHRVDIALAELMEKGVRLDPILWAKELSQKVLQGKVEPPLTFRADLEPTPTVAVDIKRVGWNDPV